MKITELDYLVRTFQFYADRRSYYLEAAKKCTKDYNFSIVYDGHNLCNLVSDDPSFIPIALQHILFSLAFDADSHLLSFCNEHDIEYDPINDDRYSVWLSAKFLSNYG